MQFYLCSKTHKNLQINARSPFILQGTHKAYQIGPHSLIQFHSVWKNVKSFSRVLHELLLMCIEDCVKLTDEYKSKFVCLQQYEFFL